MANNDLVGSVLKAMALVKIVSFAPNGMQLNVLSEAAGLKTATCFNLVRTLIAGGFLEKNNGKIYVGSEISRLSGSRFQTEFFRHAEDSLMELNRTFPRGTMIFAVPGNCGMEQTHRISFNYPGVIQRLNNEIMSPYACASGLLGLAFDPDEDVRIRIEERYPFNEHGINLWKSRKKLQAFLEKCRKDRIAVVPFDAGVVYRLSVPVFDRNGKFIAVIGASCPVRDFSKKDLESVRQALKKQAESFEQKTF